MRKPAFGLLLLAMRCGWLPSPAAGEALPSTPAPADSVHRVTIGSRYHANWLHRALFGSHYRALWTMPIAVPVLDLGALGGGLTPVSRGGGRQTTTLRLRAADGNEYYFRSIDKDPTAALPREYIGTTIATVIQDQTSAQLPAVSLVVDPLLTAAGVLHGESQLYILPDDERLGEFRSLAGLVGILEPSITGNWGGASEIIDGDELLARVAASSDDRVDTAALLEARLVDILVGDWDRHRDQWSWARFGVQMPRVWQPIPRDRDFAMVRYDGLLLDIARVGMPQLIQFGPEYSDVLGLTWNGRELDRRFLLELPWSRWEAVVAELQAAITDSVIEAAVGRLPPEFQIRWGARMETALAQRRDALAQVAQRFYHMLAEQAEVYGSDADDLAVIELPDAETVHIRLHRARGPAAPAVEPYDTRTFSRADTREIRLFLGGGRDSVRVEGAAESKIQLRVIGGDGDDVAVDTARTGRIRMHDADAGTVVTGGVSLDSHDYVPPKKQYANEIPPRDWGHLWEPSAHLIFAPDYGMLLGVGVTRTNYGFRKLPYANQHRFRFAMATEPSTFRADYRGRFRHTGSDQFTEGRVLVSGLEDLYFHGFGNELPADRPNSAYQVTQHRYGVDISEVVPLGSRVQGTVGMVTRYITTEESPGTLMAELDPYGLQDFGAVGAQGSIRFASRRSPGLGRSGFLVTAGGSFYPPWWDVASTYGEVHAEGGGFLNVPAPLSPVLLLRAGGKALWGPYPYFDAAYIGENGTIRLGRQNRYAGDRSAYVTAELHLTLGHLFLGVPADVGILGLADTGRVWLDGEESRAWHGAAGGGVWISLLDRANIISLTVAQSAEHTALHFQAGFGFF